MVNGYHECWYVLWCVLCLALSISPILWLMNSQFCALISSFRRLLIGSLWYPDQASGPNHRLGANPSISHTFNYLAPPFNAFLHGMAFHLRLRFRTVTSRVRSMSQPPVMWLVKTNLIGQLHSFLKRHFPEFSYSFRNDAQPSSSSSRTKHRILYHLNQPFTSFFTNSSVAFRASGAWKLLISLSIRSMENISAIFLCYFFVCFHPQ